MIKKIYRLKESEVKKVLKFSKPFFSYGIVLNKNKNNLKRNRFGIIISSKSFNNAISRVFFRRFFFKLCSLSLESNIGYDFVFVIKKQTKLDKKDITSINAFEKDISFLLKNNI